MTARQVAIRGQGGLFLAFGSLIGDLLLVRNGEEMAAFRLPAASR